MISEFATTVTVLPELGSGIPSIVDIASPISVCVCLSQQGRGIFASGSPFPKVTLASGQTFFPGQGNNAYVFPGVALGVIACGVRHVSNEIFLTTAEVSDPYLTGAFKT